MSVTWYPEGGFYEQRAMQGEDQWADNAQFDILSAPSVDEYNANPQGNAVAWSALIAEASYKQ